MEIEAKEFSLPKNGNSAAEYEDACKIAKDKLRFAVADGATESAFSKIWATILVRAFANRKLSIPLKLEELTPLQISWSKDIKKIQDIHRRPLPWYAEEQAKIGAFAAFVGLEFSQDHSDSGTQNIWTATAAGDSCVVQVRGDEIIKAFPLSDSASFNSRPNLLASSPALNGKEAELVLKTNGLCGCDDVFFLMTDALACWFFKESEQGNKPWSLLRDLDTQGSVPFEKFIADLRGDGKIKNDDVTLVRIDIIP